MKKLGIILFAAILLIMAGCGADDSDSTKDKEPAKADKTKTETASNQKKAPEKEEPIADKEQKPEYEVNQKNWSIQPIGDADPKVVLITIDDAPDKHALEMAKKLKKLEVPAIFFVNGHFIDGEKGKKDIKEIHDMGFVIGNHTYSHNSLPDLSEDRQKKEILDVNTMLEDTIGERPSFFRAPFGQNTDYSKKLAADQGMTLMNWTYGYDWNSEYMTKAAIQKIMVNAPELNNGANLLMHDREWTNDALEGIIQGLKDKGYSFVDPKLIKGYHAETPE